jgi:hypothetical protein
VLEKQKYLQNSHNPATGSRKKVVEKCKRSTRSQPQLNDDEATVELEDGSRRVVQVPAMIQIEVGMSVGITDFGDGSPIYIWGQ